MKNFKFLIPIFLSVTLFLSCSEDNASSSSNCANSCDYVIASGETAATVPSGLDGVYELTYGFSQTGSPFTDGTKGKFTLANNELTVEIEGQDCITLKNPVLRGTNNYLFRDTCVNDITYNVSPNNNGAFNEINIEPLGTGWLGQFFQ